MQAVLTLHRTTVGKKAIMAVTGFVLFGFVIGHLLGNLQLWAGGPMPLHDYAVTLRKVHGAIWVARAVLLGSVVAHFWAAITLTQRNRAARPVAYQHARKDLATNYAAKAMVLTGLTVGAYIVFHLMHLTLGLAGRHDPQNVYNNVVYGFQNPAIAGVYILANALLGMHLFHGAWAWFNSLGANHPKYNPWKRRFAVALAAAITLGNIAIPVSVLVGAVQPQDLPAGVCAEELGPCPGPEAAPATGGAAR